MILSQKFDAYLWRNYIPIIKPSIFQSKFLSSVTLAYISTFPLPRKFLRHYLSSKGTALQVSSKKIITENALVFDKLKSEISGLNQTLEQEDQIPVSQLLLNQANHKYALGSFSITYRIKNEMISLRVFSNYQYRKDNDRVTRHIHNRMVDLKECGKAMDFDIEGDTWTLPLSELSSTSVQNKIRKAVRADRLYM